MPSALDLALNKAAAYISPQRPQRPVEWAESEWHGNTHYFRVESDSIAKWWTIRGSYGSAHSAAPRTRRVPGRYAPCGGGRADAVHGVTGSCPGTCGGGRSWTRHSCGKERLRANSIYVRFRRLSIMVSWTPLRPGTRHGAGGAVLRAELLSADRAGLGAMDGSVGS